MNPTSAFGVRSRRGVRRSKSARGPSRASVLIVAMIIAVLIALSLTSSINLALNSMNLAERSFYQNAAVNLAEMGIEEAVYAYNQLDDVASPEQAWSGWTLDGVQATRTLPPLALGANITGTVKVHCSNYNPAPGAASPVIVTKATVAFSRGPETSKYIEVRLQRRALWARGLVVRETIRSSGGNLYVDSWDSDPDKDPTTPPVAYTLPGTAAANGSIATVSSANGAIDIAGGAVFGTISMGGSAQPDYNKNNGVLSSTLGGSGFDRDLVINDFKAVFPAVVSPVTAAYTITSVINPGTGGTYQLPRAGDTAAPDGFVYYTFAIGANIAYNGGTLEITDKVVLIFNNHSGVYAMNVGGGGIVAVGNHGQLKIYTNGDVSLGGGGVANNNPQPYSLMIYGTNPTIGGQQISLAGNGMLTASVYAPNADLTVSGGGGDGHIFGAMVANRATLVGNTRFHYDESLARLVAGNPYGIAEWRELQTSGERGAVVAKLDF